MQLDIQTCVIDLSKELVSQIKYASELLSEKLKENWSIALTELDADGNFRFDVRNDLSKKTHEIYNSTKKSIVVCSYGKVTESKEFSSFRAAGVHIGLCGKLALLPKRNYSAAKYLEGFKKDERRRRTFK